MQFCVVISICSRHYCRISYMYYYTYMYGDNISEYNANNIRVLSQMQQIDFTWGRRLRATLTLIVSCSFEERIKLVPLEFTIELPLD